MPEYYITTAIDYTNGAPHLGHAYEKVMADTLARYRRLRGYDVFFLTGVDQHGQKVQQSALKQGVPTPEFAAANAGKFREVWKLLSLSNDGWADTTDPRHKRVVRQILQNLHDKGALYKASHAGYYSVRQEQFLTEKERGEDGEFGPEWGEVIFIEEENWYFKLSDHRDWLLNYVKSHPEFVTPDFRGVELANAIARGEGDLCISRPKSRLEWGIELPFDPEFVTYVWFDALINYISFAGYLSEEGDGLPDFDKLWPCNAHVIGKDILVPAHGIYWPCMLRAIGFSEEQMPKLLVHGWWNLKGAGMSKSEGNVIDPKDLCGHYGADAVRYYLMRDIVMGRDADFSLERLILRYNTELANGLGNLLNRSLNMTARYRDGVLNPSAEASADVTQLRAANASSRDDYVAAMDANAIHAALDAVQAVVDRANGFAETAAPWKLAKDPDAAGRLDEVLVALAECAWLAATLLEPVIPESSHKILSQLKVDPIPLDAEKLPSFASGHQVAKPEPVFPRIDVTAEGS